MTAYTYPLADLFGTMLGVFVFLIWFWLLVIIFGDIFRSRDMGGGAKALWVIFVIVLPYLGVFVYLIARGDEMTHRSLAAARQQQAAAPTYVQEAAGTSAADELVKLAALKESGVINDDEFRQMKAKIVSS